MQVWKRPLCYHCLKLRVFAVPTKGCTFLVKRKRVRIIAQFVPVVAQSCGYRKGSPFLAERDRIDEELSRQNQRIAFQGPAGGNYLACFLIDITTKQEIPCANRRNGLSSPGIPCL
jgi:hypothetical protein